MKPSPHRIKMLRLRKIITRLLGPDHRYWQRGKLILLCRSYQHDGWAGIEVWQWSEIVFVANHLREIVKYVPGDWEEQLLSAGKDDYGD